MSWVALGAAVVGVVGSAVVANNGPSTPAPGQRNLGSELGSVDQGYQTLLNQQTGGTGNFNNSSIGDLQTLLGGTFNQDAYSAANPGLLDQFNAAKASGQLDPNWTFEQWAKATGTSGGATGTSQFYGGGVGDVSQNLNTQSRTSNLSDVMGLAPAYTALLKGTNADYYNQLNHFTQNANAPVQQGAAQQQAAQQASQGYGQFNPSGLYANTNYSNQTVNPMAINAQRVQAPMSNPVLQALNGQALQQGPSQLQTQQNGIASQLLSDGGNLSASDLRNVQQSSRAGFAARGLDATNASVVDEALQTDAAQRARLTQNLGLAQTVQNQGLAEQNQQQTFGLNVSGQNYNYGNLGLQGQTTNAGNNLAAQQATQQNYLAAQQSNQSANLQAQNLGLQAQTANQGFGLGSFNANLNSQYAQQNALQQSAALAEQQRQSQLNAQLQAVNAQQAGTIDPYSAIISSTQNNLPSLLGLYGTNQQSNGNLLSALLGYGSDLNNTNYNANAAAGIASGNNQAAINGALLGAGGSLGSAYLANRTRTPVAPIATGGDDGGG